MQCWHWASATKFCNFGWGNWGNWGISVKIQCPNLPFPKFSGKIKHLQSIMPHISITLATTTPTWAAPNMANFEPLEVIRLRMVLLYICISIFLIVLLHLLLCEREVAVASFIPSPSLCHCSAPSIFCGWASSSESLFYSSRLTTELELGMCWSD